MEKHPPEQIFDCLIIGGGVAGLTLAAYLSKTGYSIAILERQGQWGGYCTNFRRGDFIFDSVVQRLNGCGSSGSIGTILNEIGTYDELDFKRLDTFLAYRSPIHTVNISSKLPEDLSSEFPVESASLQRFFKVYEKEVRFLFGWNRVSGINRIVHLLKNIPSFIRMLYLLNKSTQHLLDSWFKDAALKKVLFSLGYFGAAPADMSALIYLGGVMPFIYEGAWYPLGGGGALTAALAETCMDNGAFLQKRTDVVRVEKIEDLFHVHAAGAVKLDPVIYKCRSLVNAADPTSFVNKIAPTLFTSSYRAKIEARLPDISAVTVYLGLSRDLSDMGVNEGTYFISASDTIPSANKLYSESTDSSELIHDSWCVTVYSNVDKTLCPRGKTVLSAFFYADAGLYRQAVSEDGGKKGENYKNVKEQIRSRFISGLEKRFKISGLEQMIEVCEVGTPFTNIRYTGNRDGACYGWRMLVSQMMTRQLKIDTPVRGIYHCGQWTEPGGGVSTVMMSARMVFGKLRAFLK